MVAAFGMMLLKEAILENHPSRTKRAMTTAIILAAFTKYRNAAEPLSLFTRTLIIPAKNKKRMRSLV
jgi:hypothetical protein